ncbi:unnamed protein product, partial [Ectocarpus sp. 12 AP-2014]
LEGSIDQKLDRTHIVRRIPPPPEQIIVQVSSVSHMNRRVRSVWRARCVQTHKDRSLAVLQLFLPSECETFGRPGCPINPRHIWIGTGNERVMTSFGFILVKRS